MHIRFDLFGLNLNVFEDRGFCRAVIDADTERRNFYSNNNSLYIFTWRTPSNTTTKLHYLSTFIMIYPVFLHPPRTRHVTNQ